MEGLKSAADSSAYSPEKSAPMRSCRVRDRSGLPADVRAHFFKMRNEQRFDIEMPRGEVLVQHGELRSGFLLGQRQRAAEDAGDDLSASRG